MTAQRGGVLHCLLVLGVQHKVALLEGQSYAMAEGRLAHVLCDGNAVDVLLFLCKRRG